MGRGGEEAYDSELTTSIILNMEFRYTVIEDVIRFFRLQIWGCIIDLWIRLSCALAYPRPTSSEDFLLINVDCSRVHSDTKCFSFHYKWNNVWIIIPPSWLTACHRSCEGNCTGEGPKGCQACKVGYTLSDDEGCKGEIKQTQQCFDWYNSCF